MTMQTVPLLLLSVSLLIISTTALILDLTILDFFWSTLILSTTTICLSVQLLRETSLKNQQRICIEVLRNGILRKTTRSANNNGFCHDWDSYDKVDSSKQGFYQAKSPSELEKGLLAQEVQGNISDAEEEVELPQITPLSMPSSKNYDERLSEEDYLHIEEGHRGEWPDYDGRFGFDEDYIRNIVALEDRRVQFQQQRSQDDELVGRYTDPEVKKEYAMQIQLLLQQNTKRVAQFRQSLQQRKLAGYEKPITCTQEDYTA